jgi:dTDP-4-dehydrorhamnose reductase
MITGAHGQLGHDCQLVFGDRHQITPLDLPELDITDRDLVDKSVKDIRPDILINCAAHTGVDACETEEELAWEVNVSGPRHLAESVERWGGKMVHISTDYVFGGQRPIPESYGEDDETAPVSVYGKTKLEGEIAVRKATEEHIILRTAWLYGINGGNFLKTMLRLARSSPTKEIKVVNDQFGSPTWSYRLALQIAELIEQDARGTFHATAEGVCTWYDFAGAFLETIKVPHRLIPCSSDEYPTAATRPKNSILENHRLKEAGVNIMMPWQVDLSQFVAKFGDTLLQDQ